MKHDEAAQGVVDAYARYDTAVAVAKNTHEAWHAAYSALRTLRRRSAFLGPDSNPAHDREIKTAGENARAQRNIERATQALIQAARALYESLAKAITKTEAETEAKRRPAPLEKHASISNTIAPEVLANALQDQTSEIEAAIAGYTKRSLLVGRNQYKC